MLNKVIIAQSGAGRLLGLGFNMSFILLRKSGMSGMGSTVAVESH